MKRKLPERRPAKQLGEGYTLRPRAAAVAVYDGKARMVVQIPKEAVYRSGAYLRAVAALPCAHCGRPGPSQAAHADSAGKGMGIKPSDLEVMPLCADGPGRSGCHTLIGSSGLFSKEQRRYLEAKYVAATKRVIGERDAKES